MLTEMNECCLDPLHDCFFPVGTPGVKNSILTCKPVSLPIIGLRLQFLGCSPTLEGGEGVCVWQHRTLKGKVWGTRDVGARLPPLPAQFSQAARLHLQNHSQPPCDLGVLVVPILLGWLGLGRAPECACVCACVHACDWQVHTCQQSCPLSLATHGSGGADLGSVKSRDSLLSPYS